MINNVNPTLVYPTQTIFHWLPLGLMLGIIGSGWGVALGFSDFSDFRFRNQHIGIPTVKKKKVLQLRVKTIYLALQANENVI